MDTVLQNTKLRCRAENGGPVIIMYLSSCLVFTNNF